MALITRRVRSRFPNSNDDLIENDIVQNGETLALAIKPLLAAAQKLRPTPLFIPGITRKGPTIPTFLPESVATAELAPVRFSLVFRTARALRIPASDDASRVR